MALSQVNAGYRVSIVAQDPAPAPYMREGVQIIPLGVFGRLSFQRIWAVWRMRRLAQKLQADVYQVHTVELLGVAKKLKRHLPKAKIIYDMHEDYVANIVHADYYSGRSKPILASKVRKVQSEFPTWGDGLILAEDCFQGLISFDPDRTVVVRNKFQAPETVEIPELGLLNPKLPMMLYTGTVAANWGVFHAIDLWMLLNRIQPVNLVIAGHTQDAHLIELLEGMVRRTGVPTGRFFLVGGTEYVPFVDLVALIKACSFGVALYELKENIKNRIPTKFYEFMAHGKPLVFTANAAWEALNRQTHFGHSLNLPLRETESAELWKKLSTAAAGQEPAMLPKEAWSWETEAPKMLDLIRKLTSY